MDNRITFKQYRNIDLGILCLLTAIFESVATIATSKWFAGQPMAISITLAITLIAMHRWGALAAPIAVVGGAAFCLLSSASAEHFLIYCVGNIFALLSLIYFNIFGKDSVRHSFLKTLLFAFTSYAAMALGRFVCSLPFGADFSVLVGFITSDILSLLFAVVILWIFKDVDGLVEDQKAYLFRLERQRRESGEESDGE
jgi:hypothetical protein